MTDLWSNWLIWLCVAGAIIVAATFIATYWKYGCDFALEVGFPAFIFTPMVAAIVFFVGSGLANWWLPTNDIVERWDLLVMNDKTMTSGSLVLGTGQLSDSAGYAFYIDGGSWQQFLVLPGRHALVYQDVKPGQKPWITIFNGCHVWGKLTPCFWNGTQVNEVHVPPGTIKPSLNLDART